MAPVDRENKLFVGMLPHDADDMTLTAVFSRFGEITEVCVCVTKLSQRWCLSCREYLLGWFIQRTCEGLYCRLDYTALCKRSVAP